jgi:transcriptional regulator
LYSLPYFKEQDQQVVTDFMKQYPFAMLIGSADNLSYATQIPLLYEERDNRIFLLGHMMRKQDHQKAFEKNPDILVVFTGPHTYVSATWYSNPHQASTWNYISVHARGTIRFLDHEGLVNALKKLSLHYENDNPHSSTIFDNLPAEYTNPLMRDEKSYHHIMDKLSAQDDDGKKIAEEMNKRKEQLYRP